MSVNLKSLSPAELQTLIESAQAQMSDARKNQVQEARAKIDAILKEVGLTLDDVYHRRGGNKTKASKNSGALKGTTVAPKYRNPDDASQTWTGRGRQPSWFVEALKRRGVTADSLLISGAAKAPAKEKAATKATKKVAKKVAKKAVRKKVAKKAVRRKVKG